MTAERETQRLEQSVAQILAESPIKAAAFIVTIYGDVVEPRGGVVWIGNLIDTCAEVGISETLVRTAVSRLVSAGQLVGERDGRRSYYRLSAPARAEFAAAAQVLFGPPEEEDWHFVHLSGPAAEEEMQMLQRSGYGRVNARLAVGPRRPPVLRSDATSFRAEAMNEGRALRSFAAEYWDLSPHRTAYEAFLGQFRPLADLMEGGKSLASASCLTARLLLVHKFRAVVLRDPRLPAASLPAGWPGMPARQLFARFYCALSPGADRYVGERFLTASGRLASATDVTRRRLAMLGDASK